MTSGAWRSVFFSARVPRFRIHPDFALRNDAAFVRMDVFDGILDRDDMAARIFVAMADHCGECRRLTGAGATDDDAKTALVHHDVFQDRRQVETVQRRNLGGDRSQYRTDHALLNEGTDAEASYALRRDSEITFLGRVEFLDLFVVHDGTHHHGRLIRCQRRIGCLVNRAVDLDRRRKPGCDEKVGAFLLDHFLQQVLGQPDCLFAFHCSQSPVRRLESDPGLEILLVDRPEARLFLVDEAF